MLRTSYHGCEHPDSQMDEASPLAPKLETEPRTLDSDVTLLPLFFFLPWAFSHFPPAIWNTFLSPSSLPHLSVST